MSSSTYNTIGSALTTGTIIAIVVGSISFVAFFIGIIVVILCIVKNSNRSRIAAGRRMMLQPSQPSQPYSYPPSWSYQYPPNTVNVANYPPPYQTVGPPYTVSAPNYM